MLDTAGPCRIAVVADTHVRDGSVFLPAACLERLRTADAIVHAGDLIGRDILAFLRKLGPPVIAVRGNVDTGAVAGVLPDTVVLALGGSVIGVVHDAGPAAGRLDRLRRRFPDCDAVVFGHSHVPLHETAADGFQIFNPGSPTVRRRQPQHTMGIALLTDGAVSFELLALD